MQQMCMYGCNRCIRILLVHFAHLIIGIYPTCALHSGVEVDIKLGLSNETEKSALLRRYVNHDPRVRPLILGTTFHLHIMYTRAHRCLCTIPARTHGNARVRVMLCKGTLMPGHTMSCTAYWGWIWRGGGRQGCTRCSFVWVSGTHLACATRLFPVFVPIVLYG